MPNPPAFPTNSDKANVSQTQEVISEDLNAISAYLHQIIKDFNLNVFGNTQGFAQNGCIINGLAITGSASSLSVSSGLFIFNAYPDTGATAYSGTLVNYAGASGITVTPASPPGNSYVVGVDIEYQETGSNAAYRNFYSPVSQSVVNQSTYTTISPLISSPVLTPGASVSGTPVAPPIPNGYIRIATFVIDSSGNITNLTYQLPYIWNLQGWPGGTANVATSALTLADSLSAIRYQLNAIIGGSSWANDPATSLAVANSNISSLQAKILNITRGVNMIRNGGMSVCSRGTTGSVASGNPVYTFDGFIVGCTGNTVNYSQQQTSVGTAIRLTPVGSLTDMYIKQRVESSIVSQIGYSRVTFQAAVYNGMSSTIAPSLIVNIPTGAGYDNYISSSNKFTVTSPNLQTIPAGQWVTLSYTFTLDSSYASGIELVIDFGNSVDNTGYVNIANVDLSSTPGITAGINNNPPVPQIRSIMEEKSSCLRYFVRFNYNDTFFGGTGYLGAETFFIIPFSVPLRAIPLFNYSSLADFTLNIPINNISTNITLFELFSSYTTQSTATLRVVSSTSGPYGSLGAFLRCTNANGWAQFSAEI